MHVDLWVGDELITIVLIIIGLLDLLRQGDAHVAGLGEDQWMTIDSGSSTTPKDGSRDVIEGLHLRTSVGKGNFETEIVMPSSDGFMFEVVVPAAVVDGLNFGGETLIPEGELAKKSRSGPKWDLLALSKRTKLNSAKVGKAPKESD